MTSGRALLSAWPLVILQLSFVKHLVQNIVDEKHAMILICFSWLFRSFLTFYQPSIRASIWKPAHFLIAAVYTFAWFVIV